MRMYDKQGNAIDLIDSTNFKVIDCHLTVGQSITDSRLINCDYIICRFNAVDWNITIATFGGHTLSSYNGAICGVLYLPGSGNVKNQVCSNSSMFIDRIIAFKK